MGFVRKQEARSFALREHLPQQRLIDEAPSALALLARQRSRGGEVDARLRLDELLPAVQLASDPRACLSASSTMSCSRCPSPTVSNDSACRGARVEGFGTFAVPDDDGVAERRWMWMTSEAACEGIVSAPTRSSKARIARIHVQLLGAYDRRRVPQAVDTHRGGDDEKAAQSECYRAVSYRVHDFRALVKQR